MMRRCSSGCHGNMVGTCSCALFHHHSQSGNGSSSSAFSMFFSSAPNNHRPLGNSYDYEDAQNMYSFASSSSSSVDCTLSLGTPSTRLTTENEKRADHHHRKSSFCWDIFQSNKQPPPSAAGNKSGRAAAPDVARRCANCDTTSTPLWRNGPRGPKSLCNACGIRYKKEERRASAAAATANGGVAGMDSQQMMLNNNSWVHHHHHYSQTPQKVSCYPSAYGNEFRFIEEDDRDYSDAAAGISFLSWRLNVADRPSLVHDFTR